MAVISALVNPNLLVQRNDPFTTGIIYMPIELAYVAAALRQASLPIKVIDAFGEAPRKVRTAGKFMFLGLSQQEILKRIPHEVGVIFVYANQLINHASLVEIIREVKSKFTNVPLVVLE